MSLPLEYHNVIVGCRRAAVKLPANRAAGYRSPLRCLRPRALAQQVWTTPIGKLAPQYGLSDVGLAKVCKRFDIPRAAGRLLGRPSRGLYAELPPQPGHALWIAVWTGPIHPDSEPGHWLAWARDVAGRHNPVRPDAAAGG